jgi:hypothetical protein
MYGIDDDCIEHMENGFDPIDFDAQYDMIYEHKD